VADTPQPEPPDPTAISDERIRVAVIGLGYTGLPLALRFHAAGHSVIGVDASESRLADLRGGVSAIDEATDEAIRQATGQGLQLEAPATADVGATDAVFVCVPTPLTPSREPDLGAVLQAARLVCRGLRPGQLIVLQSTTYPGTTTGPFREELERSGLVAGTDFGLAYSPERVSPGDPRSAAAPRLVAGTTPGDTARAAALLRSIGIKAIEVSSPEAAETAKLLENAFRDVNIALVNHFALLCERMGLDVWEVIDAAATKPFGYMPFTPGPGVGGHCVPVDTRYVAWRARELGVDDSLFAASGAINRSMSGHAIDLVAMGLSEHGRQISKARVGVIGVAFKPNVSDVRNSPAAEVIARLRGMHAKVEFHDPHVSWFTDAAGTTSPGAGLATLIETSDVMLVLVKHASVDWQLIYTNAPLVIDTVNSSAGLPSRPGQVLRLGAGWSRQP
jgi:UDP-N-acetyl-D-glucosamine dehydrogenase